jgi:large subunit ribosomal protein L4
MANARTARAHTKTRGEVRGGGKKPWRQKGTGRARHGSIRSPIWVGGGIAHGPRSDRNYAKRLTKKAKKAVMAMVLSDKAKSDALLALDAFASDGKTKAMAAMLKKLPVGRKVLLVTPKSEPMAIRASRNLQSLRTVSVGDVSVLDILKADSVVAPVATLDLLEKGYRT